MGYDTLNLWKDTAISALINNGGKWGRGGGEN